MTPSSVFPRFAAFPALRAFFGRAAAWIALPVFALLFSGGCESAETQTVVIRTSKRDVSTVGETVALSSSGWKDYVWSLSNKEIGRLSGTKGSSVVYTVLEVPATNSTHVLQTVTCQAIDGSGGGAFGTVEIRHLSPGGKSGGATAPVNTATEAPDPSSGGSGSGGSGNSGDSGGSASSGLVISPTSKTVTSGGQSFSLRVVSPTGHSYTWRVIATGIDEGEGEVLNDNGRVSPTSGSRTTYTAPARLPSGSAMIQCTDGTTGKSATCTVRFN